MTSKRCFFKFMKEDLRHKVWMLALSVLGSLLTGPVLYLFLRGNFMDEKVLRESASWLGFRDAVVRIYAYFGPGLCIGGGMVALIGAFIVGVFGFRYLFHKNMTDTYHSIPMKRKALFLAGYLNGFLIWFVPFAFSFLSTLFLGILDLARLKRIWLSLPPQAGIPDNILEVLSGPGLITETLLTVGVLCICFLLMYHLVLTAVMLCGNMLNTLAVTGLLGGGVISLYGVILLLVESSLDTFLIDTATAHRQLIYGSPLISAVWLLIRQLARVEDASCFVYEVKMNSDYVWALAVNLAVALALGAAAMFLYDRRPSELAEQGVRNKPVRFLLQFLAGITAGIAGWMLLYFIAGDLGGAASGWGAFGAVLFSVLVFGVLDVIFRMDFKAFVSHKALMGGCVLATLLLCFAIHGDWMGYDTWLPKQDQIEQIAVYDRDCGGTYYSSIGVLDEPHPLNRMQLTDQEAAFAFLQEAAAFEKGRGTSGGEYSERGFRKDIFWVKVTLTDGRTYYRRYNITDRDCDAAQALLCSQEYVETVYGGVEQWSSPEEGFFVARDDNSWFFAGDREENREFLRRLCQAYEQDIKENPKAFIDQGGRMLCQVLLTTQYPGEPQARMSRGLDIYEEMKNVTAILRDSSAGEAVRVMEAEEIEQIRIGLNRTFAEMDREADPEAVARDLYEVYPDMKSDSAEESSGGNGPGAEAVSTRSAESVSITEEESRPVEVVVTDPAEIEELLELLSYMRPVNQGVFKPWMLNTVTAVDREGNETTLYIELGALPEKYVLRFAGFKAGIGAEPSSDEDAGRERNQ